jgi:hypothetical protein
MESAVERLLTEIGHEAGYFAHLSYLDDEAMSVAETLMYNVDELRKALEVD